MSLKINTCRDHVADRHAGIATVAEMQHVGSADIAGTALPFLL